jgi:hypothetical protein
MPRDSINVNHCDGNEDFMIQIGNPFINYEFISGADAYDLIMVCAYIGMVCNILLFYTKKLTWHVLCSASRRAVVEP